MTNMLLGNWCNSSSASLSDEMVQRAVEKVKAIGFVGLTEEWLLSVCLFHAKFGGDMLQAEQVNVRKAPEQSSGDKLVHILKSANFTPADQVVYVAAQERFFREVEEYGLTKELCRGRIK